MGAYYSTNPLNSTCKYFG